jgi:hypothetical protein
VAHILLNVEGKRQALQLEECNAMTSDGSMEALREMMEARLYEWSQSEKKRPSTRRNDQS